MKTEQELLRQLSDKDQALDNLRRELDLAKCEINENKYQMQTIYKEIEYKNKFAVFNLRAQNNKKMMHSHQNSISSLTSISTNCHDDKYIEIINSEKLQIEKQLVEYKLRYAETASKLNELEDEFDKVKTKNEVSQFHKCQELWRKLAEKEKEIKFVREEKEQYKFFTNSHYSTNSCKPEIRTDQNEVVIDNMKDQQINIMDDYIISKTQSPIRLSRPSLSKQCMTPTSSGSFLGRIKNIFKSGN